MTTRTDFSALRTVQLAERMGARFSAPAEVVEVEHDLTTKRFARTLDEAFGAYHRSSQAWIVTENEPPMHIDDLWVCIVGVLCAIFLIGFLL